MAQVDATSKQHSLNQPCIQHTRYLSQASLQCLVNLAPCDQLSSESPLWSKKRNQLIHRHISCFLAGLHVSNDSWFKTHLGFACCPARYHVSQSSQLRHPRGRKCLICVNVFRTVLRQQVHSQRKLSAEQLDKRVFRSLVALSHLVEVLDPPKST